jgi:hypothetical protein
MRGEIGQHRTETNIHQHYRQFGAKGSRGGGFLHATRSVSACLTDARGDGLLPDLEYARSEIASLGVTYHDAVGNHEITQGADAENVNFTRVFGDTHYAYTDGAANVIVTDSAHGGLLASDAYQVPAEAQYPWLVKQLSDNTSPVVIVATHEPAYDPHAAANSEFSDRWEAQMYLRLVYAISRPTRRRMWSCCTGTRASSPSRS